MILAAWLSTWNAPAVVATDSLLPFMPHIEDFTLLCWENGPLRYLGMTKPPPDAVLCLQSGTIGVAIDTKTFQLTHAGRFGNAMAIETALRRGTVPIFNLPPMALELSVHNGSEKLICSGRAPLDTDDYRFPIRFVESGHFFQRVAIENLVFTNARGEVSTVLKGRAELAFWPDRLTITASVRSPSNVPLSGKLILVAGEKRSEVALQTSDTAIVTILQNDALPRPRLTCADSDVRTDWDASLQCQVVHLPDRPWNNSSKTFFPADELNRLEPWKLTLDNDSDHETVARLLFAPNNLRHVTGLSALLCDPDGTPTGIPVQLSKNWHSNTKLTDVLHQGAWFHGFTFVHLPPHAHREFKFEMAYAQYGGIPAASHAQLSLQGYAHNQFWDEAAMGSFGETICFEPGRIQRRCFIDDLRPFMTLVHPGDKPYTWAGNCGGGDFLMWIDYGGIYHGFHGTRTNYRAYGPCLTDVEYVEETDGGEIGARMSVSLERSDDYVRVIQHLRYDIHAKLAWQRLAFYQLGADYYNEIPAARIAAGDSNGLREEWNTADPGHAGIALSGRNAWLSIHGARAEDIPKGAAFATRGLIVRSWRAVLGGTRSNVPYCKISKEPWANTRYKVRAELVPPPTVSELRPGDFVEADIELAVFPADPLSYYGPNTVFQAALKQDANSWALLHREAVANDMDVSLSKGRLQHSYPLAIQTDGLNVADFRISKGIGFLPITFSGLDVHRDFELLADNLPVNQAIHGNDFWQTDFNPVSKQWSITYNVPRGRGLTHYIFHAK